MTKVTEKPILHRKCRTFRNEQGNIVTEIELQEELNILKMEDEEHVGISLDEYISNCTDKNGTLYKPSPSNLGIDKAIKNGEKVARFYTHYLTGSGKWTKTSNARGMAMIRALKENKIPYTQGNDAPRGGMLGNYVEFKIDKRNPFIKGMVAIVEKGENRQDQKKQIKPIKPITEEQARQIRELGFTHQKNMVNHLETADMYSLRKQLGLTYQQVREFCITILEVY